MIYSQYKRYFNTFREPIDFYLKDGKVFVFSLVGCYIQLLDLARAKTKHGEDASRTIIPSEVVMWKSD